jgi:hypothetical protein
LFAFSFAFCKYSKNTPTADTNRDIQLIQHINIADIDPMSALLIVLPVVLGFTVQPVTVSHYSFKTQLDAVGIFFGTSTGNTESVADLISAQFGDDASEPIDIDSVQGKLADEFAKYDALIVGTPTWNTGK